MIEMSLIGIKIEDMGDCILVLKEHNGDKHISIFIGQTEANAITMAQQGIVTARPMTHDLIISILSTLNNEILAVNLTDFIENIFYAELVFAGDITVSARPSDAIALAIRSDIPIFASEALLEEVGIMFHGEIVDDAEEQMTKFKDFLDQISPDDFKANDEK